MCDQGPRLACGQATRRESFTMFRKIALNLLNLEHSTKRSVRAKRKQATRAPQYLLKLRKSA
jgi:hypothetical protein